MLLRLQLDIDTDPKQPRVVSVSEPSVTRSRPDWYHALIAMGLTKDDPQPGVCWRLACQGKALPGRYFCSMGCTNAVNGGIRRWRRFQKQLKEVVREEPTTMVTHSDSSTGLVPSALLE